MGPGSCCRTDWGRVLVLAAEPVGLGPCCCRRVDWGSGPAAAAALIRAGPLLHIFIYSEVGWGLSRGADANTGASGFAYVRCIVHLPRIFFHGPDYRFCSLHAGNEPEHVFACRALYVRACGALISCVDMLLSDMGWQFKMKWDLVALLTHESSECWFPVEPYNTIAARQRALRQLGGAQHIIVCYS